MSKISIVIPVYNASKYIERCVNSIQNNTFKDFELLLINDGSTDKSIQIINELARNDNRIRVIDKPNEGVAKTRNLGIKQAKSEYIMFVDNDDYVEKDYLQKHWDLVDSNNADVAITGHNRTNTNNEIISKQYVPDTFWARYLFVSPWAKIYKRTRLIENKVEFFDYGIGEDVVFWLKLISIKPCIVSSKYIGYNWFYNDDSVSNTAHLGFKQDLEITFLLDEILKQCPLDDYLSYFIRRFSCWYLLYSGKNSSPKDFEKKYHELDDWIIKNNISKNIGPFSKKISGEKFSNRLAVLFVSKLKIFHMVTLFAKIYCNGKQN